MLNTQEFGDYLQSVGLNNFVGVPCSYLAPLINYAINSKCFIMSNNEGDAVAIASGISLCRHQAHNNSSFEQDVKIAHYAACHFDTTHNESKESQSFEYQDSKDFGSLKANNTKSIFAETNHVCANKDSNDIESYPTHTFYNYGVVLMQNSGLSNALSPLTSLNYTFNIPILGFVSLRGERDENGKNTDEPQHELLGVITDKLLETCEIKYAFLDSNIESAKMQIQKALQYLECGQSFFFIVRDKTFSPIKLDGEHFILKEYYNNSKAIFKHLSCISTSQQMMLPTRLQALTILHTLALEFKALLLATTGKCGRELYEINDTPNQLYMVGSMGCVSSLALGVALKSTHKVIAIDGDSALLMRLGVLSTNAYYTRNRDNFCHILLDNESHDSTGGQFNLSPFVDFASIAKSCGYANVYVAKNLDEFTYYIKMFLEKDSNNMVGGSVSTTAVYDKNHQNTESSKDIHTYSQETQQNKKGAWFIYLQIAKGSKENLGRPKITPKEVAKRFANYIK